MDATNDHDILVLDDTPSQVHAAAAGHGTNEPSFGGLTIRPKRGFTEYMQSIDSTGLGTVLPSTSLDAATAGKFDEESPTSSSKSKTQTLSTLKKNVRSPPSPLLPQGFSSRPRVFSTPKSFSYSFDFSLSPMDSNAPPPQHTGKKPDDDESFHDNLLADVSTPTRKVKFAPTMELISGSVNNKSDIPTVPRTIDFSVSSQTRSRPLKRRASPCLLYEAGPSCPRAHLNKKARKQDEERCGNMHSLVRLIEKVCDTRTQGGALDDATNNGLFVTDGVKALLDIAAKDDVHDSFLKATRIDFRELLGLIGRLSRTID
ncbi:hypothetical protein HOO65_020315 [Ceratocystis lukuohia]|uniref:Uncharacterized protein n=1 Tax=Ceratocystis lukuohia TaxID=2019550 RepID=A0ABR4MNB1_9PEZI